MNMQSEIQGLLDEVQKTVAVYKDHAANQVASTNSRIDELEALIRRAAPAGGPAIRGVDNAGGDDSIEQFESYKVLRKGASLVANLHGREGVEAAEQVSLARLLKGHITQRWNGAERELELATKSAQSLGSLAGGGFLVPDLVSAMIVDAARPQSVTQRLGAGVMPIQGLTALPYLANDVTPEWKSENDEFAGSLMQFGAYTLNPKTVGFLVRLSRELLEDSGPELERFVRSTFSSAFASVLDQVTLRGSGANNQPIGILNKPGIVSTGSIGSLDYSKLIDGAQKLFENNFAGTHADIGAVMNPRTAASLAKIAGTANDHYIQPPEPVREMRRLQSTAIPVESGNTEVLMGDFRQCAVALRTGFQIEATTIGGGAFEKHQLLLKATARLDVVVFRPSWFHRLHGITN